jgi:CRISPR-associated protein Cst2
LDLRSAGTFWSSDKTGFKNLDEPRINEAKQAGLSETTVDNALAYRLSDEERSMRIAALLKGIANLEGGAKQALHYTDVTPSFLLFAVTRGGNNIFHHTINSDRDGNPQLDLDALEEVLRVYANQLLSPLFIGWPQGYMNEQRQQAIELLEKLKEEQVISGYLLHHPRHVMYDLAERIQDESNYHWLR